MKFLKDTLKGIAIGAGAILPGISSGVLCVIMGIYEKLLDSALGFFKDIKKNTKFLLPLVIGGVIGIVIFSNLLNYLFYEYSLQIKSIFIGLILGSVPNLIKEVNSKEKFNIKNIVYILIAFVIGLITVLLEKNITFSNSENISLIYLILSGFAMSVGIIVPGVSSTIILMLLGIYSNYIYSVSTMNFAVLVPMGIGLLIGCIMWMKITKVLLNKYYAKTFYTIIGFTLGSIMVLLPTFNSGLEILISILCMIIGANIVNLMSKVKQK